MKASSGEGAVQDGNFSPLSNLTNSAEKLDPIAITSLSTIGVRLLHTGKEGDGKVKTEIRRVTLELFKKPNIKIRK
jgi:hypothetical protein